MEVSDWWKQQFHAQNIQGWSMLSWGPRTSWDCLNTVQVPFRPWRKLREQHLLLPSVWCCLESCSWLPPSLPALCHQPDLSGAHLPKPNVRMTPIFPLRDFAVTLTPSPAQSAPESACSFAHYVSWCLRAFNISGFLCSPIWTLCMGSHHP